MFKKSEAVPRDPSENRSSVSEPLLLVDVGNTRVKFGLFRETLRADGELPRCDGFVGLREAAPDFWKSVRKLVTADPSELQSLITGSNPRQMDRLVVEWPVDWPSPRVLADGTRLPLKIDVDEPRRVGIDRLLDAVAANVLRPAETPAIVIDVGTATTVNAISNSGAFVGGAILAGPELSAKALHEYTAVLPHVLLEDVPAAEPDVIGRNTESAITSGLYWGHWQAIMGYCERMRDPLGCPPEPLVILTGGAAHLYADRIPHGARYEPHLTLQGLAVTARHLFAREARS